MVEVNFVNRLSTGGGVWGDGFTKVEFKPLLFYLYKRYFYYEIACKSTEPVFFADDPSLCSNGKWYYCY